MKRHQISWKQPHLRISADVKNKMQFSQNFSFFSVKKKKKKHAMEIYGQRFIKCCLYSHHSQNQHSYIIILMFLKLVFYSVS